MKESLQHEGDIVHPTMVSLLRMRAEQSPCDVAYRFVSSSDRHREVTYAELDRRARVIASMLSDLGMSGKPVMLLYPPGIDFIAAFFGCLYAGAIAVPACPPDPLRLDRSLPRLVAVARDAMPSAVLTTEATETDLRKLSGASPELSWPHLIQVGDVPEELSPAWAPSPVDPDSITLLQYTSGSTSAPKGAIQADLGSHVTASDLSRAASIADLAVRLDEQLSAAASADAGVRAAASLSGLSGPDMASARLYCWVRGARVPVHAAAGTDS
jgi:acyl-CoA synthetase (AMP-forming)/AMP-acid ligase II